jgi:ABC-type molybdenum transport system ATPase subunit/photorepair protein PhrA
MDYTGNIDRLMRLSAAARTSAQLADADREARDVAIEQAEQAGASVREIARWTGLSWGRVQQIIVARTAHRQARLARSAGLG